MFALYCIFDFTTVYGIDLRGDITIHFIFVTTAKMAEHPVELILQYRFSNHNLLDEALLAAGASVSSKDIKGDPQGNKRLALLGDSVLQEAVLEPWYNSNESTGNCKCLKASRKD